MTKQEFTDQDTRRYQWMRQQFAVTELQLDGSYRPVFRAELPRELSLDDAIDKAMEEKNETNHTS